ncbi:MAG: cytochrome c biogenesis protein CcsA [Proteobacteria bacterium]|nr:cytochrome c biogenesis protein CcsA [Pseudomonadota bacterium]
MILSFGPASGGTVAGLLLSLPSAVALAGYALAMLRSEAHKTLLRTAMLVGWVMHGLALVIDIGGLGSDVAGARFGFAPALSATLWMVLAVYGIESRVVALPGARRTLALLGVLVILLAWLFPGEVRPRAPSPWAPLHWLLGLASYGLFGVAVLHAAMLNRAERHMRQRGLAVSLADGGQGLPLLRLERLTFRFVAAGFAVLSATLVLGAWFTVPWRWDDKIVLSILGWIVFAALLAGRKAFGWRGPRATRWLYAGAALLLLAYVGSRFAFEVLLRPLPSV